MSDGGSAQPRVGEDVRSQLVAAGLDPDDLEALIGRAVDEDLDGGVDVTTVATVPVGQRATLDLVARRPAWWPACRWRRQCSRTCAATRRT